MMKIKILWPGRTQNEFVRGLEQQYLQKIVRMEKCVIQETKEARGIPEKNVKKILDLEADGIEKHIQDDYLICLTDTGKEMDSTMMAGLLNDLAMGPDRAATFVVGGFLGLAERLVKRADLKLALSMMTFSHELSRVMLLEQLFRALSILKGRKYAK
ncbi:23S rRNA (pseudouridine(1915)-N(3))-methyltransferase RlmH [Acidobacteriota bacterium]